MRDRTTTLWELREQPDDETDRLLRLLFGDGEPQRGDDPQRRRADRAERSHAGRGALGEVA